MMKYKYVIFDFDGVLAETNTIRIDGFKKLFSEQSKKDIDILVEFCVKNGGTSRYERIRFFYNEVLAKRISEEEINSCANQYSLIVKEAVINSPSVLGADEFLYQNRNNFTFALVSGSDQSELIEVCRERGVLDFFEEVLGSPVDKHVNLKNLVQKKKWNKRKCIYIGDSITDFEAAKFASIDFIARDSGMTNWALYPELVCVKNLLELKKELI